MIPKENPPLTNVELEFMQILWNMETATPEDIRHAFHDSGRILTGGSVRKMLLILMDKGWISRMEKGRGYTYFPLIGRDQARRSMLHDLILKAFGGSPAVMIASLMGSSRISQEEISQMEQIITQYRKERDDVSSDSDASD